VILDLGAEAFLCLFPSHFSRPGASKYASKQPPVILKAKITKTGGGGAGHAFRFCNIPNLRGVGDFFSSAQGGSIARVAKSKKGNLYFPRRLLPIKFDATWGGRANTPETAAIARKISRNAAEAGTGPIYTFVQITMTKKSQLIP
jgi:hypothetical protein